MFFVPIESNNNNKVHSFPNEIVLASLTNANVCDKVNFLWSNYTKLSLAILDFDPFGDLFLISSVVPSLTLVSFPL